MFRIPGGNPSTDYSQSLQSLRTTVGGDFMEQILEIRNTNDMKHAVAISIPDVSIRLEFNFRKEYSI